MLSTQISAAKTSLDRLLTDIGSPAAGNLIPVRTTVQTRTQAPRSAAEGPQERPSVTRYAEGTDEIKPQGFGGVPKTPPQEIRSWQATTDTDPEIADTVLYHGTDKNFDAFQAQKSPSIEPTGVSLSPDPEYAARYGAKVIPVYVKGRLLDYNQFFRMVMDEFGGEDTWKALSSGDRARLRPQAIERVQGRLEAEGYAGLIDKGEIAPEVRIFDPSNIRMAPTDATPPIKGMGFGAGTPKTLTSERELGNKMKREKKD